MSGKIIVIEGLIGAGKSTICSEIVKHYREKGMKCKCFPETVDIDFLNLYISDMKKYAFAFQLFMMNKRLETLKEAQDWTNRTRGIAILDRSLHGDMAFGLLHMLKGNMNESEWKIYENLIQENSILIRNPDKIIYLDVSIENCLKRTQKRDRTGEDKYTLEYFSELSKCYEDCMAKYNDLVTRVDWNGDINTKKIISLIDN